METPVEPTKKPNSFYFNRETGQFTQEKPSTIDTFVEIENTFAEMCHHSVTASSVLENSLFSMNDPYDKKFYG